MAERTLNSDRLQTFAVRLEEARDTHDCIGLEGHERVRRIVQVDLPSLHCCSNVFRHCIHVDLEPELECLFRADTLTDTAELLALDRLVELQVPTPKVLATKSVEPKGVS